MNKQKATTREFNRLYSNLVELCRRVYDSEHAYPKKLCADWFINDLRSLMSDNDFTAKLTNEQIVHIVEMGSNLLRTEYINKDDKAELRGLIKQVKSMFKEETYCR